MLKIKMNRVVFALVLLTTSSAWGNLLSVRKSDKRQNDMLENVDWYENTILYQIYPRSFQDSNGDGIGDINGIISRLAYLQETGIQTIWLSPVLKSPQKDFGYDISDFRMVDPIFGTNDDLIRLFAEAKTRGIKVILDFVPNHTSNEHEWFIKSELSDPVYKDFYVWHPGKTVAGRKLPPNNWQSVFYGSAWEWSEIRQEFYLHQFVVEQPDLNYRNEAVVQAMQDVLIFWLEQGVDGFRIDAINHMFEIEDQRDEILSGWTSDPFDYGFTHHDYTKDLHETYDVLERYRKAIDKWVVDNKSDTKIMMTEAYANLTYTMKYYQSDAGEPISHFPFNFIMIENLNEGSNANDFKSTIDTWMDNLPEGKTSNWVLGNHDKPRVGTRYGPERIDGLLALVMTLPGVAVTYNGEEIGMVDNKAITWEETVDPQACNAAESEYQWRSRDPSRAPYQWDSTAFAGFSTAKPWLPTNQNYLQLNLELQMAAEKSHYKFYKQLVELRSEHTFKLGGFRSQTFGDHVFAHVRELEDHESFVVLINLSDQVHTINVTQIVENLNEEVTIAVAGSESSHTSGDRVTTGAVTLGKYDILILRSSASGLTVSIVALIFTSVLKFLLF